MTDWIILVVYLLGYLLTWKHLVRWLIEDGEFDLEHLSTGDIFGIFGFASLFNVVWPLFLTIEIIYAVMSARHDKIVAWLTPRYVRSERALMERERRISELEREVLK
jgi:hypothetical protein